MRNRFTKQLDDMRDEIKTLDVNWKKYDPFVDKLVKIVGGIMPTVSIRSPDELYNYEHSFNYRWAGKYRFVAPQWEAIRELGLDKQEIERYAPGFLQDVSALTRRGMHRTMAIDLLFGKVVHNRIPVIHDVLLATVEAGILQAIEENLEAQKYSRYEWQIIPELMAVKYAAGIIASPLAHNLTMY
jgi:hypothetical protein